MMAIATETVITMVCFPNLEYESLFLRKKTVNLVLTYMHFKYLDSLVSSKTVASSSLSVAVLQNS